MLSRLTESPDALSIIIAVLVMSCLIILSQKGAHK